MCFIMHDANVSRSLQILFGLPMRGASDIFRLKA
jgi:hypothetical protein